MTLSVQRMQDTRGVRPNRPGDTLLEYYVPLYVWELAEKQARRSQVKRHRTGAVIFASNGFILSKGCSHSHPGGLSVRTVHAEMHALGKLPKEYYNGERCLVVSLTRCDNYATSSRPCVRCAEALKKKGVLTVIYAEKANDGTWCVNGRSPQDLLNGNLVETRLTSGSR